MPLKVVVASKDRLYALLKEYKERGYTCRADDDGDWECYRRVNEIMYDTHYIIVKP